jgi:alkylated DNA repair dioxygenase AlkB
VARDPVTRHELFGCALLSTRLPYDLARAGRLHLAELWELHPRAFPTIRQPFTGKSIALPRWQQAYGREYAFSGNVGRALPLPPSLVPFLAWAREEFDRRLNGLLLTWYDAERGHYIGPHRDSTVGLIVGSPIVTISLGATRIFRVRPYKGTGVVDFPATHGSVFVLPWATNLHTRHEVPRQKRAAGCRISITARAFAH